MSNPSRDQLITNFRSTVITNNTDETTTIELFQNEVLRPILKFQHTLLIALFHDEELLQKQLKKATKKEDFIQILQSFIAKEAKYRSTLIGSIIGLFSEKELQFYLSDKKNCNKRIISMIIQRFTDTYYKKD